ncbi:MAG TPA: alpha/beta hydrolase [Clostridia bacterium]|nr:alpha/beta hydrolase [Clostridia bacterium]
METALQSYAMVGDLKMYYEISGNPDGEWLILLHGIAGSTRCWKYQIDDFNKHFKVLKLDLVGHGKTTPSDCKKYSGVIIANHIRLLMDELGIGKAHILGLSLGTVVQQYFCELFPERIISLIFASPACNLSRSFRIMNRFAEKVLFKIFGKDFYLKMIGKTMLPGKVHEKSRKFFIQETVKMDDTEFLKWWKVGLQGDHYFYLSQREVPTLIVVGSKDFFFYDDAVSLKDKYINSDFRVIKGAGHVFIFEKGAAQQFNQMVVDFTDSLKIERQREYLESDNDTMIA